MNTTAPSMHAPGLHHRPPVTAGLAAVLTLLCWSVPEDARACGGFFCDGANPVNQEAERIIFAKGDDGVVTALIEIKYSGPSDKFAWMLPVAGSPKVKVSSNAAFDRLQTATNPQYRMVTTVEGVCREPESFSAGASGARQDAGVAAPESADGGGGINVLQEGSVGPYDYVVIEVDPDEADKAITAVNWLNKNGYDVNDFGSDRLRPYLDGGMNLLTFRLTKGNDTGAIRPVVLSFGEGLPSIPLRPTAVAATEDMGVMVWVLGERRAVPANYFSLELNDALINWFAPLGTYNNVVIRAANEAGGQGFVTEMAGEARPLADTIFTSFEKEAWAQLSNPDDWEGNELESYLSLAQNFGQLDGFMEAAIQHMPEMIGDIPRDDILSCPFCYRGDAEMDNIPGFDPVAFLETVLKDVIEPMARTAKVFRDHRYMTRMYTTMSPDEMTKDPAFDFNTTLGDYSNDHVAERVVHCRPDTDQFDAYWTTTLPSGQVVEGKGSGWPYTFDDETLPANAQVKRIGPEGVGDVVTDNVGAIEAALGDRNADVLRDREAQGPVDTGFLSCSSSAAAARSSSLGMVALFLGTVFGISMRRRAFARRGLHRGNRG
ncbi:MAG: DUF2330 domain-containing protein [Myxococcales bacterium]|nr:DUF2330 domain-containing protein [Myxococcales bacterium]